MTHEILKQKFNVGYIFAHTSMADLLATTSGLGKAMDPHPSLPDEEWLSQEWFDAIRDVVEITKEANAYVTYADEYMWPSGRANGRVVKQHLEKHGMYYVSNLWEESLQWVASTVGDLMKAQRRFSLPGTDALTLKVYDPHDLAESHSVAAFEGRRLECEFMGAGGWGDLTMQNLKASINAVTTRGANHIVPHALFMTRKQKGNVWVPDYFDELPVWPYLHVWSDFIRRTSFINSQGNVVPEVLLLNPLSSAWALRGNPEDIWGIPAGNVFLLNDLYDKKVQEINHVYSDAIRQLQKKRI